MADSYKKVLKRRSQASSKSGKSLPKNIYTDAFLETGGSESEAMSFQKWRDSKKEKTPGSAPNPFEFVEPVVTKPVAQVTSSIYGGGSGDGSAMATNVAAPAPALTFSQAFGQARKAGQKTFKWTNPKTGKTMDYGTALAGEENTSKGAKLIPSGTKEWYDANTDPKKVTKEYARNQELMLGSPDQYTTKQPYRDVVTDYTGINMMTGKRESPSAYKKANPISVARQGDPIMIEQMTQKPGTFDFNQNYLFGGSLTGVTVSAKGSKKGAPNNQVVRIARGDGTVATMNTSDPAYVDLYKRHKSSAIDGSGAIVFYDENRNQLKLKKK